jgi:hypothetical protein
MFKVIKRTLVAGALVAAASAPSTAYATPVLPNPDEQPLTAPAVPSASAAAGSVTVRPNPDEQVTAGTRGAGPVLDAIQNHDAARVIRQVVVPVTKPNAGFDWGDAGIGAAAAIGLAMLGVGAAFARSQRRARRPGRSSVQIS